MTNRTLGAAFLVRFAMAAVIMLGAAAASPAVAQDLDAPLRDDTLGDSTTPSSEPDAGGARSETGGPQTLEDVLARQRGEGAPSTARTRDDSAAGAAASLAGQLGARGGASDAEIWSELRHNTADITVSTNKPRDRVLVQDGGMDWLTFRAGPLQTYGGWLLIGVIAVLLVFYLIRGRVRIEGEKSGITIERFKPVERFAHWLLAGSFILLALTGLVTLFGRVAIIPLIGLEAFSPIAMASKWVHNNVAWAFMPALVLVFVFWIAQNIPNRHDLVWLAKGGGMFTKGTHPPARKFNAGQKLIFWAVIILGFSVSLSGLSLLFPFELPMFAKTFAVLNDLGASWLNGGEPLPTALTPHAEMQLSSIWHAIVGFLMMAVIIGHIYIGTLGMEGAYDAMGSGEVDLQWAKEHHDLWVEEVHAREGHPKTTQVAR